MFFGYRTLKTAVGAGISLFIAERLQLDFFAAAGIITVLCITATKKGSLKKAWELFLGSCTGLFFASVIFTVIGFHPLSVVLLLLLFIPALQKIKAVNGVVTSTVILLHVYSLGEVNAPILMNEIMLIFIGVTVGLVMNLYMPSIDEELYEDQLVLEEQFSQIWREYTRYLRENHIDWDGKEIMKAEKVINEGKAKALRGIENHFMRHDNYFYHYFDMRGKQFEILERILPFVSTLPYASQESERMAEFMEGLSVAVHPGNTASYYLEELGELNERFKQQPLPGTQKEFETRASLFYILHELEQYLLMKETFRPDPKRTLTLKKKKRAYRLRRKEKK